MAVAAPATAAAAPGSVVVSFDPVADTDVTFNGGRLEVIPEPATLALLLTATAFTMRRRR